MAQKYCHPREEEKISVGRHEKDRRGTARVEKIQIHLDEIHLDQKTLAPQNHHAELVQADPI